MKKFDLVNYVFYCKVIIDLLEKLIECIFEGKYVKEEIIYELIMLMRKDLSEVFLDFCNLWLVDEWLVFYNYLVLDKLFFFMLIVDVDSGKEFDLLVMNIYDNLMFVLDKKLMLFVLIIVVEIKCLMCNDVKVGEDKDLIE